MTETVGFSHATPIEHDPDRLLHFLETAPLWYDWKKIEETVIFYAKQSDVWYRKVVVAS